MVKMQVHHEP
jgi:hypothetical protein